MLTYINQNVNILLVEKRNGGVLAREGYSLIIEYGDKYKNSYKGIKNKHKEKDTLELIINHIKLCKDFQCLSTHPVSLMYGFEPLKYELNGYYSFNLNKNIGVVRLIVSTDSNEILRLEFVSVNHYDDFKNKL